MNQQSKSKLGKRKLVVVVAIVASVALAGTYFGVGYFFQPPCPSGVPLRSFVIIANDSTGYNDSRYQQFQMNAQQGDCVLVTFVNNSTNQPHGLAITYYYNNGMVGRPRTSQSVRFQATKTGQFRVSEQLLSTINAWTDNCGTLNVA